MSHWQRIRTGLHLFAVGVRRRMVLGTRVAILDQGKVLLLRHTYVPGWHFPGGGVEPGETAEAAARREVAEETGLAPRAELRLFGLFHNVHQATNRDHVALFVCAGATVIRPFRAGLEIAEINWFDPRALPRDVDPGTARRVTEIVDGEQPSARW